MPIPVLLLLAAAALVAGCASAPPQVVESANQSVTITGSAMAGRDDVAVYTLARMECRKQGRRQATLVSADTLRMQPQWRFHCVH